MAAETTPRHLIRVKTCREETLTIGFKNATLLIRILVIFQLTI